MEPKMFTVLALLMLFCVILQSTALKCYTCSSTTNPECADVNDNGFLLRDCTFENTLSRLGGNIAKDNRVTLIPTCLKLVLKRAGVTIVDRRCSIKYQNEDPCTFFSYKGNNPVEFCGSCEQDGCNTIHGQEPLSAAEHLLV